MVTKPYTIYLDEELFKKAKIFIIRNEEFLKIKNMQTNSGLLNHLLKEWVEEQEDDIQEEAKEIN